MKKNLNKKGFTLVELLAVIVILGIIMLIAIPSIAGIITNARKDSFVQSMGQYIKAVHTMDISQTVERQYDPTKATVVSLRAVDLDNKEGDKATSTFGAAWDASDTETRAYVVIWNRRTAADPDFKYYFAAADMAGNCIALTLEGDAERTDIQTGCTITPINENTSTLTINVDGSESKTVNLDKDHIYLTRASYGNE